jgi:hypothetical protein
MPQSRSGDGARQSERGLACAILRALFLGGLLLSAACGVDERSLRAEEGASGRLNGASGAANDLRAGAGGAPEEMPLPRCVYLGTSVESGCETLVKNAGFASNVASWVAEPLGMSESWLKADANDDPHSGAMVVMNLNYKQDPEAASGTSGGAARQCIPINAATDYELAVDVFVPAGQGAGFEGVSYTSVATLSVFYYEGADCIGRTLSNFTSAPVDATDEWVHVEGRTRAPKESQSMAVRLATLKPFRQIMFEAHFDNVLVRERPAP